MFKVSGGVKQFLAVAVSLVCVFFAGVSSFADDHIEEGKRLLFDRLDIVGAHAEFDQAVADLSYDRQVANFWHALTAISGNGSLKSELRALDIFDIDNKPAIIDKAEEFNYNAETAVKNIIVDNDTPVYSDTGSWVTVAGSDTNKTYDGNCRLLNSDLGSATWTIAIPTPGYYRVYAWGGTFPANTTNAQYVIGANPPVMTSHYGSSSSGWRILGTYNLAVGDVDVTLSGSAASGEIKADGVKFEYVGIIKNDTDAGFSGTWSTRTSTNAYMSDYRLHDAGAGDSATWTFSVPDTSKDYLVYAKWPGIEDAAPTRSFTVTASGGPSKTIEIQDFIRKDEWRCLGVFHFPNATGNSVRLDSSADGNVAADAVKIAMARSYPDMTASQVILSGSAGTSGMLTEMSEALNNFTFVTTTFSDTINSEQAPMFENDVTLDYGDAKAIETMFYFQEFNMKLNAASEMDNADERPLIFGGGEGYLWLMMLGDYPDLFKSRSGLTNEELTALLGDAKSALLSGIDAYLAASDFIRSRGDTDGLNHMISFYPPKPLRDDYPSDEEYDEALANWENDKANALSADEYARGKLGEVKENLTDPKSRPYVTIPAYLDEDGYMGTGIDINVNFYAFFSGPKNIRAYMNQVLEGLVRDDFSGVDLDGVLPNFGPVDWNYILGNGPYFSEDPIVLWNNNTPSIKLNWDASEDKYYANISKYEVWRVPSVGATKVTQGAVLVDTITDRAVNAYTDTTVGADSDFYYYRLYTYYTGLADNGTAETYTEALKAVLAVYVDAATTISPEKGSKSNPYKDLGEALDEASDGTKVCVAKGTYHESDQTLHMWGKSGLILEGGYSGVSGDWERDIASNETIIDGAGVGGWSVIMFNEVTGGTLDGFTVTGAFMHNDARGVELNHATSIVIKNCKITDNRKGIGMWNGSACSVENCRITQSRLEAIQADSGSSLAISDSTISQNGADGYDWTSAISVYKHSSLHAERIKVTQNTKRGIGVTNLAAFDVKDSDISGNGGIGFYAWCAYGRFFNNLVANNGKMGIQCAGSDAEGQDIVDNNTVIGNGENGGIVCNRVFSTIEVDNQQESPAFAYSGAWERVWDGTANWGECRVHESGSGPDTATWTSDIRAAGSYKVYATWTGGPSHSNSAQYQIHHAGGTATVSVNQQTGTSTWPGQLLGTYNFAQGTGGYIVLGESPAGQVVADSVKIEYVSTGSETFKPIIKDNIVVSNNGGFGKRGVCSYDSSNPIVSYNDVYGNTNGNYDGLYTNAGGNISADPLFVPGTYNLSQTASGQAVNSPCVDAGSDTAANLGLGNAATRSDGAADTGIVDMGYHYPLLTVTVNGKITDKYSLLPVANVEVSFLNRSTGIYRDDTTDANGEYMIGNLPKGEYLITIEPPSPYAWARKTLTFTRDSGFNIALAPEAVLFGAAKDYDTTLPIPQAMYATYDNYEKDIYRTFMTKPDAGSFVLTGLPEGIAEVMMKPDISTGYAWRHKYVYLAEGEDRMGFDMFLRKGALITGTVKKSDNSKVSNAPLYLKGSEGEVWWGQTDRDGNFSLRLPGGPANKYCLSVSWLDPAAVPAEFTVTGPNDNKVINITGYDQHSAGHITGSVANPGGYPKTSTFGVIAYQAGKAINKETNRYINPVSYCEVNVSGGSYDLVVPPDINYDLYMVVGHRTEKNISSYTIRQKLADVSPGSGNINFNYTSAGGIVTGAVTYKGSPVLMAKVFLSDFAGNLTAFTDTDQNGAYNLYNVPAGDYVVSAWHSDHGPSGEYMTPEVFDGGTTGGVDVELSTTAEVVGRRIFYNKSAFDGNGAQADPQDDNAIAPDKSALRLGEKAGFSNYTSYVRGINGVMVDIKNLKNIVGLTPGNLQDYLLFKVGNDDNPRDWTAAPSPSSAAIRRINSDTVRITLVWNDGAIKGRWLEIKVLANDCTGLAAEDIFYFGNAIGESGNSAADAIVSISDLLLARANPRTPINPADITFAYDYNRDRKVNASDVLIARSNQTNFLSSLRLITPAYPEPVQSLGSRPLPARTRPVVTSSRAAAVSMVKARSIKAYPQKLSALSAEN